MADRTFCEWGELLIMAEYMTNDIDLTKVANAIRNVSETEEALSYPDGFVATANEAANKFLRLDGSKTMTGALDMGSQRITNVGAPTADDDAVRKTDLDEKITDPTTKANGQVLTYNETTGSWEAGTPAAGGMTQAEADARYLQLSGGDLTGAITLLSDGQITSKYGDTAIMTSGHDIGIGSVSDNKALMGVDGANKKLYLGYGTTASVYLGYLLAGKVNFTPTNDGDIVSKKYVDQYAPHATLVTLTVAGWNSTAKTQTVTVSGILADESKQLIIPMPAVASMTVYNDAGIQCTGQAANSLTFTAETVPNAAISVYVTYQTVIS
nr:MAG TPA: hypothetical protein [Bacteriophage sp.]